MKKYKWMWFFYYLSYDNLESQTFHDIAKLSMQHLPSNMVIHIVINTIHQGSYTLRLESGHPIKMTPINYGLHRKDILYKFIHDILKRESAINYAIMFSSHGNSYYLKQQWLNTQKKQFHHLHISDISDVFSQLKIHFDLLCFDACLMGNIECLYEFSPFARYIIAFQSSGPMEGVLTNRLFKDWNNISMIQRCKNMIRYMIEDNIMNKDEIVCCLYDTKYVNDLVKYVVKCDMINNGVEKNKHLQDFYDLVIHLRKFDFKTLKNFKKVFNKVVLVKLSNKKTKLNGLNIGCYKTYPENYIRLKFYNDIVM